LVVYGGESWSVTLREEQRLRVFENRALKRIFGCYKDGEEIYILWIFEIHTLG
jgi:hypothetical protein